MKVKKLNENFEAPLMLEELEDAQLVEAVEESVEEVLENVIEPTAEGQVEEIIEEGVNADKLADAFPELEPAVADYYRLAGIEEGMKLEGDLDEWALNEAACKNNVQKHDLKHKLLGEDITLDQAARELESEETAAGSVNQIEAALDRALKQARRMQRSGEDNDFPNVLLISDAGFGKSSVVRQWAKERGINLVYKDAKTMDAAALGGIIARDADDPRYANRLGTKEFLSLDKPNSVLFLDEYNRAKKEIRGSLLTLVQDHVIWDPTAEGETRFLPNFLFTVAAINPPNANYKGAQEMDPAERSRFNAIPVQPDPMEHLRYLRKFYKNQIENAEDDAERLEAEGRLALAETILSSPKFTYDSSIDIDNHQDDNSYSPLNYRSFKKALDASDGTKADLLAIWSGYCNYDKKNVIEDILENYQDVKDKANSVFDDESESEVFANVKSNSQKLFDKFPNLRRK